MADTFQFHIPTGAMIAVLGNGDNLTIVVPGVFELTIDRESAAVLAKAIFAKAIRMSAEQAHEFLGDLVDETVWQQ